MNFTGTLPIINGSVFFGFKREKMTFAFLGANGCDFTKVDWWNDKNR